jgi:hypothetical protein
METDKLYPMDLSRGQAEEPRNPLEDDEIEKAKKRQEETDYSRGDPLSGDVPSGEQPSNLPI